MLYFKFKVEAVCKSKQLVVTLGNNNFCAVLHKVLKQLHGKNYKNCRNGNFYIQEGFDGNVCVSGVCGLKRATI